MVSPHLKIHIAHGGIQRMHTIIKVILLLLISIESIQLQASNLVQGKIELVGPEQPLVVI